MSAEEGGVLRQVHRGRFETVSVVALEDDSRLSWKAVGILLYMLTRPQGWNFYRRDLTNRHSDGKDAVSSGLKELREHGYLLMRPNPRGGWSWWVTSTPIADSEWDATIGAESGFSDDGNPEEGKPGRITNTETDNQEELTNTTELVLELTPPSTNGSHPKAASRTDFEELWKLAPGRGAKGKAWERYRRAVPAEVSADDIYEARMIHVEDASDMKYVKGLDLWIRDKRWTDAEAATPRAGGRPEFGRLT